MDCGPGTVRCLGDAGVGVSEVERVVLSHFHTDHVLDLFALAFARRNPSVDPDELPELEVIGPEGLGDFLAGAPSGLAESWRRAPRQRVTEVPAHASLEAGGLRFTCQPARHSKEALHWRADLGQRASLTFSGDTGEHEGLPELARSTDLLIAECAFGPDETPDVHLNAGAAGRAARDAEAGALLLTHFYPHVDPRLAVAEAAELFGGPVLAAHDGMALVIEGGSVRVEPSA